MVSFHTACVLWVSGGFVCKARWWMRMSVIRNTGRPVGLGNRAGRKRAVDDHFIPSARGWLVLYWFSAAMHLNTD
ncbi:hypothetical protein B0T26DRAFT_133812 [Lasiosphaeria miniovina]|uniref:Uncharacterized protein n=1 Tax=Lasiosphaeria miniovina TaxID=1954250 RepID=A0AA40B4V0_9PEZI|nr:uncharacterized protein B0T26DRAFT_133812 [Lasiosphaeria miniovina]KAK0727403.1 hypothetical protein B0T26DRAFT_133812 [Lasiosphaeria miniovina]